MFGSYRMYHQETKGPDLLIEQGKKRLLILLRECREDHFEKNVISIKPDRSDLRAKVSEQG